MLGVRHSKGQRDLNAPDHSTCRPGPECTHSTESSLWASAIRCGRKASEGGHYANATWAGEKKALGRIVTCTEASVTSKLQRIQVEVLTAIRQ